MSRNYTVQTKILRPIADVFDAIISSDKLGRYFVNGASSDLTEGAEVVWRWDHYGENTVVVRKVVQNELIELSLDSREWEKTVPGFVQRTQDRMLFHLPASFNGATE